MDRMRAIFLFWGYLEAGEQRDEHKAQILELRVMIAHRVEPLTYTIFDIRIEKSSGDSFKTCECTYIFKEFGREGQARLSIY